MATNIKIKITDNDALRAEIDHLAGPLNQIDLAKWAILCAKHILPHGNGEFPLEESFRIGFQTNERWQEGNAGVHEVRQAGFKLHALARQCKTMVAKTALRTAGHAAAVGHMKAHAMICSDYAIKTIQLAFPDNLNKITEERQWQLNEMKQFLENLEIPETHNNP